MDLQVSAVTVVCFSIDRLARGPDGIRVPQWAGGDPHPHPYLLSVKVTGFSNVTQSQATRARRNFGTIPLRTWLQPRVHRAGPGGPSRRPGVLGSRL